MELRYAGDAYLPDSKVFYSPTQKSYQADKFGGFRQKSGSYEIGYIYYVVGERLYNGDLLEQTANNRIVIPNRFPLVSTFGRDATLTLNASRATTDSINVLFTDGRASQMTLQEAEEGLINVCSKDQLARLMLNLARKPLS